MTSEKLNQPALVDLADCGSVAEISEREGFTPELYAIALAESVRNSAVPLDVQRERLAALAQVGGGADKASADELARHFSILSALFERFAGASSEAIARGDPKAADTAETFMRAAERAQKASLACLSALRVLRESPTTSTATTTPAPAVGST